MASYIDLSSLHSPVPRAKPSAAWGAQIRENFEFLHDNRRVVCTSSTRPASPFEGLEIYETDTNRVYIYDGGAWVLMNAAAAWQTYTPTWTQSATVTKTTTRSEYRKAGRLVTGVIQLSATSSGTASNAIKVSTPWQAAWASNQAVGSGYYYNGSANFPIHVLLDTVNSFSFVAGWTAGGYFGTAALFYPTGAAANTSFTPTVASGHAIVFNYSYETNA